MKLNAYLLAADPAWIQASVLSYYDIVDELIVSYDRNNRAWTGATIAADVCVARLKAIDHQAKMRFAPGDYWRPGHSAMGNDTHQRQCAFDLASVGADWVLSLDTDEVLPDAASLLRVLQRAQELQIPAVEWPMRVLYQRLPDGAFLEVCDDQGADRFDYPGPIATRPGQTMQNARRTTGRFFRPVVRGDNRSLEICRPPGALETREELLEPGQAIIHNSWARSPMSIKSKIRSWGHADGWRSWAYYWLRWSRAPRRWRRMRNFHPFANGYWPALKISEAVLPQASRDYAGCVD